MSESTDHTATFLGITATYEVLRRLRDQGMNPWLTLFTGTPIPARRTPDRKEVVE